MLESRGCSNRRGAVRRRLFLAPALFLGVFCIFSDASAELPPLFDGELAVCRTVAGAIDGGQSLPDALLLNIQGLRSNDPALARSIRRTFIHNAITVCGYDAVVVIEAGYLAGLPIELVVGSAIGAGVDQSTISGALLGMGVGPQVIQTAFDITETPDVADRILPPALEVGSGLGQTSPYLPTP